MTSTDNEKWIVERDKIPPRVFGRGAMMKHNIPLSDLRPPEEVEGGDLNRDSLVLQCSSEEARQKIGRIRAFVQRHIAKLERNRVEKKDLPQFPIMFGKNKESILIWRTR